jgi:Cd2+/Zn2+-exporting ATPase
MKDTRGHHHHDHGEENAWGINREWWLAGASLFLLVVGLLLDFILSPAWFRGAARLIWYSIAYLPVGFPVIITGVKLALKGEVFTEFLLMGIATIGAFYIGEYPEGVAVMVFYAIGELFQNAAVNRAKRSIKALLDVRSATASVYRASLFQDVDPVEVKVDERIQVKSGERVPLDGVLLSEESFFNTAALTGESKPAAISRGESVLAGMINDGKIVEVKVTKLFNDSSLARILTLVQNAQGRKAKTELFIRRFAKIYTPIVVLFALALTFLPYFFVANYNFEAWLYRALIFLVISCPCALVVAIPLGYFGGIGAGSRNGILFKGSSYLDRMTRVKTVVMDKTGTLTKGVFKVQQVISKEGSAKAWLPLVAAVESQSTHPIAKAIVAFVGRQENVAIQSHEEIKGYGLKAVANGKGILAGNLKLLAKFNVAVDSDLSVVKDTLVAVAIDKVFVGYLTIADEIKDDASEAVRKLHSLGIKTVMLSGDKQAVVDSVAKALNIATAYGDLLPEDKVRKVEELKKEQREALAFVGDGINDAPVLAISDVGIAMGGLGSDVAIETADVVIQTDQPSKIVTAINIGKATNAIVWQNIGFAFGVKLIVMALGAWGIASMWEAVFADVGVALLAIMNAMRIQRMNFDR